MKGITALFITGLLTLSVMSSQAQVKVDLKKKVNKETNQRANRRTDQIVDKSFDKLEEGVGNLFKKKDKKEKADESENETTGQEAADEQASGAPETDGTPQEKPQPQLAWNKYDFVPGTEIIFEDNFEGEQNGEFPSRWDMTKGTIEIAQLDDDKVVMFRKTYGNGPDAILPLLNNRTEDYLPDEFTVEFDAYFPKEHLLKGTYYLYLYDKKNQIKILTPSYPLRFSWNTIDNGSNTTNYYPGLQGARSDAFQGWRHMAVSFNKRALKAYMDDARVLNIPNCEFNPTGIMISFHNPSASRTGYIKNVRVAKGAVPLYDKFLTDGKFVTTGIKFDVNKATIRPESMGTINYVVKMMQEHAELNFSVEGHTDSDGEDAMNQSLSEARAKAVAEKMTGLGISSNRLTSKGWGESKPMAGNDTPEGKAQNRRVEFVKF
ncbi:MAG: OmpA family protein [Mangrovibacterium sp.]